MFNDTQAFEQAQRFLKPLLTSTAVPEMFRGVENMGNALMAMEMANRLQLPYLMVVQNLVPIHGRLSWASTYIISAINECGKFKGGLRWKTTSLGKKTVTYSYWEDRQKREGKQEINDIEVVAYAKDRETGEIVEGVPVTLEMAIKEGWYHKNGSKWQTNHQLMIRYRAATFFGRLYCPEVLIGLKTHDEFIDIGEVQTEIRPVKAQSSEQLADLKSQLAPPKRQPKPAAVVEVAAAPEPEPEPVEVNQEPAAEPPDDLPYDNSAQPLAEKSPFQPEPELIPASQPAQVTQPAKRAEPAVAPAPARADVPRFTSLTDDEKEKFMDLVNTGETDEQRNEFCNAASSLAVNQGWITKPHAWHEMAAADARKFIASPVTFRRQVQREIERLKKLA